MIRLNLNKLQKNWKHLVGLFIIVLSVSTLFLVTPSNHPANAFLGISDVELINIQEFTEDLLESFAETLTEGVVKTEVSNAIDSTLNQYHIGSYLQYATNLKNQVFTAQAIAGDGGANKNQMSQYIVQSMISDIDNNPVSRVSIDPLLQKAALNVVNPANTSGVTTGPSAQNLMALSGSFAGNAGGQYILAADLALKVNSKATAAANKDISTANGNKSTYNCTNAGFATGANLTSGGAPGATTAPGGSGASGSGSNSSAANSTNTQVSCALQNPGQYVGNVIAGNLNGLFARAVNPPNNHLSAIAGAIGSAFAGIAQQELIGGSKGGTLIGSTAPTQATPTIPGVKGAATSPYGTLYALDANGNVIAGSSTSISNPVAKGSSYVVEWNAGLITGATYVAFAPCSSGNCAGSKDKKELDGSLTAKASGAVQTYTLQVWGIDDSGSLNILETDSIAIKVQ